MKIKTIFPAHVYAEDYLNFNQNYLDEIKALIVLLKKGDSKGRLVSNYGFGWQSQNIPEDGVFLKLTQEISKKAWSFGKKIKNFKFNKIVSGGFWANVNNHRDINWPHKHGGDVSGVYYVDTHINSGDLQLLSYAWNDNDKIHFQLHANDQVKISPKNDKLIIFDSHCVHAVLPNLSKKPRISISFNFKFL